MSKYVPHLRQLLPTVPLLSSIYGASEGFFGVQSDVVEYVAAHAAAAQPQADPKKGLQAGVKAEVEAGAEGRATLGLLRVHPADAAEGQEEPKQAEDSPRSMLSLADTASSGGSGGSDGPSSSSAAAVPPVPAAVGVVEEGAADRLVATPGSYAAFRLEPDGASSYVLIPNGGMLPASFLPGEPFSPCSMALCLSGRPAAHQPALLLACRKINSPTTSKVTSPLLSSKLPPPPPPPLLQVCSWSSSLSAPLHAGARRALSGRLLRALANSGGRSGTGCCWLAAGC